MPCPSQDITKEAQNFKATLSMMFVLVTWLEQNWPDFSYALVISEWVPDGMHKSFGDKWRCCTDVIFLQRRLAFVFGRQLGWEYITGFLSEIEKASDFFHILALMEPTALGELWWLRIYFYVLFRFSNCSW